MRKLPVTWLVSKAERELALGPRTPFVQKVHGENGAPLPLTRPEAQGRETKLRPKKGPVRTQLNLNQV